MSMTYDTVVRFVGTYGQLYMVLLFVALVGISLWPRKGRSFDEAARIPLDESRPPEPLPPCCGGKEPQR
jgi:cbb3-type cytochrome oxidase subunit 3